MPCVRPQDCLLTYFSSVSRWVGVLPREKMGEAGKERRMIGTVSIQGRAKEAAGWFETATRAHPSGFDVPSESGESFVRVKDGAPEWVTELARKAHGDMLPDDYRYKVIRSALDALAYADEAADLDDLESEFADDVDLYTSDLTAWLGSHAYRVSYCDDARDEYGQPQKGEGIMAAIALGQYMERREVFRLVRQALEEV